MDKNVKISVKKGPIRYMYLVLDKYVNKKKPPNFVRFKIAPIISQFIII